MSKFLKQTGLMSFEKFYSIYGDYGLEILPEAWKYINLEDDNYTEIKEAYESPDVELEEENSDDWYLDMYEIAQERIKFVLSASVYLCI